MNDGADSGAVSEPYINELRQTHPRITLPWQPPEGTGLDIHKGNRNRCFWSERQPSRENEELITLPDVEHLLSLCLSCSVALHGYLKVEYKGGAGTEGCTGGKLSQRIRLHGHGSTAACDPGSYRLYFPGRQYHLLPGAEHARTSDASIGGIDRLVDEMNDSSANQQTGKNIPVCRYV